MSDRDAILADALGSATTATVERLIALFEAQTEAWADQVVTSSRAGNEHAAAMNVGKLDLSRDWTKRLHRELARRAAKEE